MAGSKEVSERVSSVLSTPECADDVISGPERVPNSKNRIISPTPVKPEGVYMLAPHTEASTIF